jgi:hypothetical protein
MMAKETGDGKTAQPSSSTTVPVRRATVTPAAIPNRVFSIRGATVDYRYAATEASSGGCCSRGGNAWGTHDNEVITSQYKAWNFIPRNLFLQFSNVANLYFLFIGILQIIKPISTTGILHTYETCICYSGSGDGSV